MQQSMRSTSSRFAGTKNVLCDLAVQSSTEERIDWRRTAVFGVFGLIYVGAGQWLSGWAAERFSG